MQDLWLGQLASANKELDLSSLSRSLSRSLLFATPWTATQQASLSIANSQSLLKLMSIGLVMASNHVIICHPLLLLPSMLPSIRVFSNVLALCIRWPKYWSFNLSVLPMNIQGLFTLGLTGLILKSKGHSSVICNTRVKKH